MYDTNNKSGSIKLIYTINSNIKTNKAIVASIRDGNIKKITLSHNYDKKELNDIKKNVLKEQMLEFQNKHGKKNYKNDEKNGYYFYDFDSDELSFLENNFVSI